MGAVPVLPNLIVSIAKGEVGVREMPPNSNLGPRVNEYKAATTLKPNKPWLWCAAFVCWVVREAMFRGGVPETPTFRRPTTAVAWNLENWSRAQDQSTSTLKPPASDIEPGDIVIFTFSHCGIAISRPDAQGNVLTVEGNTNESGSRNGGGVFQRGRSLGLIRSRVRFRV